MTELAWANIMHRKLRSVLAALAVAIGIAMLVTMLALSHGTLTEVAQRVKGIDAELIVLPSQSSLIFSEGAPLADKYIEKIKAVRVKGKPVVKDVIPVYLTVMPKMAGQQQRVFAVQRDQFATFAKGRPLLKGDLFDPKDRFRSYLDELKNQNDGRYHPDLVAEEQLNQACKLVIDNRLAKAGNYRLGDTVPFLGRDFTICGIVEAGAAGRVFAPLDVVRLIEAGGMARSSLFFVKLDPAFVAVDESDASQGNAKIPLAECADALTAATHQKIASLGDYDQLLFDSFRSVYVYINIASGLILVVCFLFIMVTIYTMVLERRREIGILRSMGAKNGYILSQTLAEALIISLCGTAIGIILAFAAKYGIESFRPLLTVDIQPRWLVLAIGVGFFGGLFSALYPGYCALRQDPLEALGYE
jgi:putative ABC transport system permease protein